MPRGRSEPAVEKFRRMLRRGETLPWKPVLLRDPCVYCAVWPMPQRSSDRRSLEHIQPLSEGGANDWRNYASAHASCNEDRSSTPLLRFFLYRQLVAGLHGRANKRARRALRERLHSSGANGGRAPCPPSALDPGVATETSSGSTRDRKALSDD